MANDFVDEYLVTVEHLNRVLKEIDFPVEKLVRNVKSPQFEKFVRDMDDEDVIYVALYEVWINPKDAFAIDVELQLNIDSLYGKQCRHELKVTIGGQVMKDDTLSRAITILQRKDTLACGEMMTLLYPSGTAPLSE
jgi:hypothetical protein